MDKKLFEKEVERLIGEFREGSFTQERVKSIWRHFNDYTNEQFIDLITNIINSNSYFRAPTISEIKLLKIRFVEEKNDHFKRVSNLDNKSVNKKLKEILGELF